MIVLQLIEVDTSTFSCDSTRSASNSKADLSWVLTIKILMKIQFLNSSIFEKLYCKKVLFEVLVNMQKRFKMRLSVQCFRSAEIL